MKHKIILLLMALSFVGFHINAAQKRCLMVGISDYGNSENNPEEWSNLSGANDIKLLYPAFKKQGFLVDTLTDGRATKKNILASLEKLATNCQRGDIVYIHFSCHGQPVEDTDGDEEDGWDEAIIPVDAKMNYEKGVYEGENHILDDELYAYINRIQHKIGRTGILYVVMDACHSGGGMRGTEDEDEEDDDTGHIRGTDQGFTKSNKPYVPDQSIVEDRYNIKKRWRESQVVYVEACRSYQLNREKRDKETDTWYGSVSYYISKALQKHTVDQNFNWLLEVRDAMGDDWWLRRQNLVIETSLDIQQ